MTAAALNIQAQDDNRLQDIVLDVRGMRKEFPGTLALDDVSLSVRRGEIHALLGENGAGKSTLIKCICGAYAATSGDVHVEGQAVSIGHPRDATAAGIAYGWNESGRSREMNCTWPAAT